MSKFIAISGCSGGGKSTLIDRLAQQGFIVVHEVGRKIVNEQFEMGGDTLPWQRPKAFCELLIKRSIEAYEEALTITNVKDDVIFFDRIVIFHLFENKVMIFAAHNYP